MNHVKFGLMVALFGLGATSTAASAADKSAQKDRIEDRADHKKDEIDRNADHQKAKVDREAEMAKDRVDDRVDGKDHSMHHDSKATTNGKTTVGEEVSDAWITTKVKSSFIGEDTLKGSDISVDTENRGVVVLTGTAPSSAARLRAAAIASGVKGVRSVRNDIRIAPAH